MSNPVVDLTNANSANYLCQSSKSPGQSTAPTFHPKGGGGRGKAAKNPLHRRIVKYLIKELIFLFVCALFFVSYFVIASSCVGRLAKKQLSNCFALNPADKQHGKCFHLLAKYLKIRFCFEKLICWLLKIMRPKTGNANSTARHTVNLCRNEGCCGKMRKVNLSIDILRKAL